jgi:acyl-[acyl-carrier-protein]-phospholipid O-acyltransferase/long-chain-fatty-acid--[acyl-carrier-protein] ligase
MLVTTKPAAETSALLGFARERGVAELTVPRLLCRADAIPVLGTGKTNYPAAQRLAEASGRGGGAA